MINPLTGEVLAADLVSNISYSLARPVSIRASSRARKASGVLRQIKQGKAEGSLPKAMADAAKAHKKASEIQYTAAKKATHRVGGNRKAYPKHRKISDTHEKIYKGLRKGINEGHANATKKASNWLN